MQDLRLRFWLRYRLAIIPQVPSHTNHINNAAVLPKSIAPDLEVPSEKIHRIQLVSRTRTIKRPCRRCVYSKVGVARYGGKFRVLHFHGRRALIRVFYAEDVASFPISSQLLISQPFRAANAGRGAGNKLQVQSFFFIFQSIRVQSSIALSMVKALCRICTCDSDRY